MIVHQRHQQSIQPGMRFSSTKGTQRFVRYLQQETHSYCAYIEQHMQLGGCGVCLTFLMLKVNHRLIGVGVSTLMIRLIMYSFHSICKSVKQFFRKHLKSVGAEPSVRKIVLVRNLSCSVCQSASVGENVNWIPKPHDFMIRNYY